jgi:P27 family predicted phage terminase small subunit
LKLVQGNPGGRRINAREPEPVLMNDLEPPAHIEPRSAVEWRRLAPLLRRNQVFTEMDCLALEMLCDQVADYRLAREARGDRIVMVSEKSGAEYLSAYTVAQQAASRRAGELMGKFGMDPVSRSRIMLEPQGDLFGADPSERFFKK